MTFIHSPGPWSLTEYDDNNVVVNSPSHGAFCSVVVAMADGPAGQIENDRLRGNAQLVVHALAMYEMLKELKAHLNANGASALVQEALGRLLMDIENVPVSRQAMLDEVVEDMVLSLGSRKTREEYVRRVCESMQYEELVKAYNDMKENT